MGMGSWIVRFCLENHLEVRFTSQDTLTQFVNNQELVKWADVIFLAVPISSMTTVIDEIYPFMNGKLMIDVCSVKKFIFDKYHSLQKQYPHIQATLSSVHPMFSQTIQQLTGQVIIIIQEGSDNHIISQLKSLWNSKGAFLYDLEYLEHDKMMGLVQGLNHFSVFVSAKTLQKFECELDKIKNLSSPAYRIFVIFFTRYVLQNPALYADIQIYNEFVLEVVKMFKAEVDRLYTIISQKNKNEFVQYVNEIKPYFSGNKIDDTLSNHLIEQLGLFLKEKKQ
ncbi:MAG: hypothetical protein OHK0038_18480 [Flammeovirgaceae bacterium]